MRLPLPGPAAHESMMPAGGRHRISSVTANTRRGAVLITLVPSEEDTEIPLIQRTDDGGPHALQISLPGGAAEPVDRTAVDTALREAQEEIGLESQAVTVLGMLSELYIDVSDFLITPVVAWYDGGDPERTLWPRLRRRPREVRRIVRGSLGELDATLAHRRVYARGRELIAPSFLAEEEIVWGATAMILGELLHVVRPPGRGD
ncbi:MAG: CoA pyrophosphatase [Alkalispirochaeta sp.]